MNAVVTSTYRQTEMISVVMADDTVTKDQVYILLYLNFAKNIITINTVIICFYNHDHYYLKYFSSMCVIFY